MADAVALERMGVPATTIGVDLLINTTGKATARLLGAPDLPLVVLPSGPAQPFTDVSPAELRSRALVAADQIEAIFTGRSERSGKMTEPLKAAEGALAELRQGLEADGYLLHVSALTEGALEVRVQATDRACKECLVPEELFRRMIEVSLPSSLGVTTVSVIYPHD